MFKLKYIKYLTKNQTYKLPPQKMFNNYIMPSYSAWKLHATFDICFNKI